MTLLLLLLLQAKQEAKPADTWVALLGGDVETVTKGRLKGATVLIRNDKIHRIGTEVEIPAEAARIDCTGKLVLPGFVVCSARGLGVSGFTSSPKLADAVDPFQEQIQLALASGITSAFVETGMGGGLFGGRTSGTAAPNAVLKMTYGDLEGMILIEPSSVQLSQWVSGTASERFAIRESFVQAREYLERVKEFEARKAAGKAGEKETSANPPAGRESYVRLLKGESLARISAGRADEIRRALQLVNDFKFKCVLTDVTEGWTLADEIGRSRCWCVVTPRRKVSADKNSNLPSGWSIEQCALLRKSGVKFGVTTLTPSISTGGIAGRDLMNLNLEAAFAIRGGCDAQGALESITISAAEICGVDTRVGSIEEGKDADLIVLDGDPFDYRTFVLKTIVNGRLMYDKSKADIFNHIKGRK